MEEADKFIFSDMLNLRYLCIKIYGSHQNMEGT